MNKSLIEKILNKALENGGEFADIFIEKKKSTLITSENNKIEKINTGEDNGIGLRLIKNGKTYYGYTNLVEEKDLLDLANILSSSQISDSILSKELIDENIINKSIIKDSPENILLNKKTELLKELNELSYSYDKRIRQVTLIYSDTFQDIIIANSNGKYSEDKRTRTRYFINLIAIDGNIIQTSFEGPGETSGFELISKYKPKDIVKKAADRVLLMLEAPYAPRGQMPVVLTSQAGGTMIHEACGHALEADFIYKKTSVFTGKTNEQVSSPVITVIDDATIPNLYGTFGCDDEGTPAQRTVLIENGILKNYMSDCYYADLLNIPKSGNGRRESYRQKPTPRMTNTFIEPKDKSPDEIISSVKNGLLVKKMGGGQVNITNGDFVFEVNEGYLVENGKIKHPVKGATLVGNGPEVLKSIDMIGNDIEFIPGTCGKYDHAPVSDGQPTLRIPELIVGGQA